MIQVAALLVESTPVKGCILTFFFMLCFPVFHQECYTYHFNATFIAPLTAFFDCNMAKMAQFLISTVAVWSKVVSAWPEAFVRL